MVDRGGTSPGNGGFYDERLKNRFAGAYLTLRRSLGLFGVLLPVALALLGFYFKGCVCLQDSISDYYSLRTRDVLVGCLFAIATFLFVYKGYDDKDDWTGDAAALCALGVALFPNSGDQVDKTIHFVSALGFFLALAYFCLALFTKSGKSPSERKKQRNVVYVVCGVVILCCLAAIGLYFWLLHDTWLAGYKPVFFLESLALWAFGASWFIKGETLLKDR